MRHRTDLHPGGDAGLDEPVVVSDESAIDEDDADLTIAQEFCKIQTR